MLRVWAVSGAQLVTVPSEELTNVEALKLQLHAATGIPVCLQQLLLDGSRLPEDAELQTVAELLLRGLIQIIITGTISGA